jgi:hypothetical protein
MPKRTLAVLASLLAVLVAGGAILLITDDDTPSPMVTTKVDTLDAAPDADETITVPRDAVEDAAKGLSDDEEDHTGSRDETPPNVAGALLTDNAQSQQENRRTTDALPTAGASGGVPGCRTAFVRNQSGRNGVRPTVQVLHYTVSPNRPGRSDVDGITAYFNRSSSGASSHFVIDADGNCNYIVPIERKAWTQAGGNPWSVSYEIIATGRERNYLNPAGYKKLRSVIATVKARTGIPLRAGRVGGCSPSKSGIVQHANGGSCWGGHHDIGPFNFAAVVRQVTAGGSCNKTCQRKKRDRATHAELKRRNCGPPGKARSSRCKFLNRRHAALHRVLGKPVPR